MIIGGKVTDGSLSVVVGEAIGWVGGIVGGGDLVDSALVDSVWLTTLVNSSLVNYSGCL